MNFLLNSALIAAVGVGLIGASQEALASGFSAARFGDKLCDDGAPASSSSQ